MTRFTGANALSSFAVGDTTTVVPNLNGNFDKVKNVVDQMDAQVQAAAMASTINSGDAGNLIENAAVNGSFLMNSIYAPGPPTHPIAANTTHQTELVRGCDAWFYKPTYFDSSGYEHSIYVFRDEKNCDLIVRPSQDSGYTGALTGSIFQRLDYFYAPAYFQGRNIQLVVEYTAVTSGEFHLSVNDGVGSTNSAVAVAGSNQQISVGHLISASATKLTISIVLDKDAADAPNSLVIHNVYARFGAGTPVIPAQMPPPNRARDAAFVRTMVKRWTYFSPFRLSSWVSGSDDVALLNHPSEVDLVGVDANDIVMEGEWLDSGDSNSVTETDTAIDNYYSSIASGEADHWRLYNSFRTLFTRSPSDTSPFTAGSGNVVYAFIIPNN